MKPTFFGIVFGWLLSCWVQVPPPMQSVVRQTVETAAHLVRVSVATAYAKIRATDKKEEAGRPNDPAFPRRNG